MEPPTSPERRRGIQRAPTNENGESSPLRASVESTDSMELKRSPQKASSQGRPLAPEDKAPLPPPVSPTRRAVSRLQRRDSYLSPSPRFAALRLPAAVFLALGLFLAYSALSRRTELQDYCIVIDAGSSGTRLHVYAWAPESSPQLGTEGGKGGGNGTRGGPHVLPKMMDSVGLEMILSRRQRAQGKRSTRKETEPGLDRYFQRKAQLQRNALGPLLAWATSRIPMRKHASTPLFLFATAGLRRLPADESTWILEAVRDVLEASGFSFQREWARILRGSDEATFGWVALNYMRGTLDRDQMQGISTVGSLDLGGSSLEVTFEMPPGAEAAYHPVQIALGSQELGLYARSFEGYGMNDAFDWTVGEILKEKGVLHERRALQSSNAVTDPALKGTPDLSGSAQSDSQLARPGGAGVNGSDVSAQGAAPGPVKVHHPCLHQGFRAKHRHRYSTQDVSLSQVPAGAGDAHAGKYKVLPVSLVGRPDAQACARLAASAVLRSSRGDSCRLPECALGEHNQPAFKGTFFALAGFHIVANFFEEDFEGSRTAAAGSAAAAAAASAEPGKPRFGFDEILTRGTEYCAQPFEQMSARFGHIKGFDFNCFRAPYTVFLLRDGLGLKEAQVVLGQGHDMSWTLGAAILEGLAAVEAGKAERAALAQGGPAPEYPLGSSLLAPDAQGGLPLSFTAGLVAVVLVLLLLVALVIGPLVHPALFRGWLPGPLAGFQHLFHASGGDVAIAQPPKAAASKGHASPVPSSHIAEGTPFQDPPKARSASRLSARRASPTREGLLR